MSTQQRFGILASLLILAAGCNSKQADTNSDEQSLAGGKYLLAAEPVDARTPTEIKESVSEPTLVAVAGRIDAGEFEPFEDGVASFMISQLPDAAHAESDPDHADNCPFCKRKLKNAPKAIVRVLDEGGEVVPVDARKLLGLAKGDVVVVEGVGHVLRAGEHRSDRRPRRLRPLNSWAGSIG